MYNIKYIISSITKSKYKLIILIIIKSENLKLIITIINYIYICFLFSYYFLIYCYDCSNSKTINSTSQQQLVNFYSLFVFHCV
jgi:hypothetical protein